MASSIGDDVNLATKPHHTTLNQLTLQFLPLALPPNTSSHHLYAIGISHFHPLYAAFETSIRTQLCSNALSPRLAGILQELYISDLERAKALQGDIDVLLPPSHRAPISDKVPRLEAFQRHIQESLARKPHLAVAYTWIFYMALFSGGRYIRSRLRAGLGLSISSTLPVGLYQPSGLAFWEFPGEHDGEDLKLEYKKRLTAVSLHLTEEERADIIEEGVYIMVHLTGLVREVAEVVPDRAMALALQAPAHNVDPGFRGPLARIRPPWLLLVRTLFPFSAMEFLSAALGFMASRVPGQAVGSRPLPVQLRAE
ncbi:MAG: hypothetical protein Q9173_002981 [Seirophora scorigena]